MAQDTAPKRRGRPPLPDSERKGGSNLTFRARAGLRERLLQEATAAGRSISEEIERRLERTFELQDKPAVVAEAPLHKGKNPVGDIVGPKTDSALPEVERLELLNAVERAMERALMQALKHAGADPSTVFREFMAYKRGEDDHLSYIASIDLLRSKGVVSFEEWKAYKARLTDPMNRTVVVAEDFNGRDEPPSDGKAAKGAKDKSRVE